MILNMTSNNSIIDMSDAPKNNDKAPPKLLRKDQIVGYCGASLTSSTSSDEKKMLTCNE